MYNSKRKFGIEFRGTQKEKNRLIAYDKTLDLHKSANRDFVRQLANPVRMFHQADNTLRIETNHTSLKNIRDRLTIHDNTLESVLNSTTPVNHNFLLKVMNYRKDKQLDLFDEFKKMNLDADSYIRLMGISAIYEKCNNDRKLTKEFFKFMYGDRFSYQYYKSTTPLKKLLDEAIFTAQGVDEAKMLTITDKLLKELKKTA
jgi:hypothetical protein